MSRSVAEPPGVFGSAELDPHHLRVLCVLCGSFLVRPCPKDGVAAVVALGHQRAVAAARQ